MPALPAVPGVIKIILKQKLGLDVDCVNILHFSYAGTAPTDTTLLAVGLGIFTAWNSDIVPDVSSDLVLDTVELIDLTSSTAAQATATGPSNSGSLTTPALAAGSALVQKNTIARRYRGGHPRVYWAGNVAAQLTTAQEWNGGFLGSKQGDLIAFFSQIVTLIGVASGAAHYVNVSYFAGFTNHTYPSGRVRAIPNLRPGGPVVDQITAFSLNPRVGSQRRRNLQGA